MADGTGLGIPGYLQPEEILTGLLPWDFEEPIMNNRPKAAPLISLVTRAGRTRPMTEVLARWATNEPIPRQIALLSNYTGGTSDAFVVASGKGKYFMPSMLFVGDNGRQYRTLSVAYTPSSGDTVSFVLANTHDSAAERDSSNAAVTLTSADNMASGTYLHLLGNAQALNADATAGWTDEPTTFKNYFQNFYAAVSGNLVEEDVKKYGGSRRLQDHALRQVEMATQQEAAWLVGKMGSFDTASDGRVYLMDGFKNALKTNDINLGGSELTEDALSAYMGQITDYASAEELVLIGSSKFVQKFQSWGRDKVLARPDDKTWGFVPMKWQSTYGEVPLIRSRSMDLVDNGICAFAIAFGELKKLLFKGGSITMTPNVQTKLMYQKFLDIYVARQSLQYGREKFHSYIRNWTV